MSYHEKLNLDDLSDTSLAEGRKLYYRSLKRRKKLDPGDFVEVKDGFHTVIICHFRCAGIMVAVLSELSTLPQETWTTQSLRVHDKGGVPIKLELDCRVCDGMDPGWKYESTL